jgi:hypothetical protein
MMHMTNRAYLSNLSPAWPISRQEELLATALPGWPKGVTVHRDIMKARDRQAHQTDRLVERAKLLRPSSRPSGETIWLAALPVLAWGANDLLACLTLAASRNATVRVLQPPLTLLPSATAADLHEAMASFADGKKRAAEAVRGLVGGKVSGELRKAAARQKAETIKTEWSLPSDDYPTLALLDKAGISRNTAKLYLGPRAEAQRVHLASLKRAATRKVKHNG